MRCAIPKPSAGWWLSPSRALVMVRLRAVSEGLTGLNQPASTFPGRADSFKQEQRRMTQLGDHAYTATRPFTALPNFRFLLSDPSPAECANRLPIRLSQRCALAPIGTSVSLSETDPDCGGNSGSMGKSVSHPRSLRSASSNIGRVGPMAKRRSPLRNLSVLIHEQALLGIYGEKCFPPGNP